MLAAFLRQDGGCAITIRVMWIMTKRYFARWIAVLDDEVCKGRFRVSQLQRAARPLLQLRATMTPVPSETAGGRGLQRDQPKVEEGTMP